MKNMTRRHFIKDSLIFSGASFFLSREYTRESQKSSYPSYLELEHKGILAERIEKLFSLYENCHLCPRDCRINRNKGQTGHCNASAKVKVSSAFPHFGEESPLVGKSGSGTIFFSNCGLRCIYCQNYKISIEGEGQEISDDKLAELMIKLENVRCHNINLVTPTHYVPNIVNALQKAVKKGLSIPLVYNTGGYESLETLKLLDGIVDIYLPDCKYMDPEFAAEYSDGAYNYPYYVKIALKEMYRQVGDLVIDGKGVAVKGLMVRHLILPERIAGTEKFIRFVAENLSRTTYVNIMDQYRPEYKAFDYPKIGRRITRSEYNEVIGWAQKYGLTRLDR